MSDLQKINRSKSHNVTIKTKARQTRYRNLVGTFIWITVTTRPDIGYAVSVLCKFMQNSGKEHYTAAIWLLRYLNGTSEYGIKYTSTGNLLPVGYCDADFCNDESRRSVYAYIFMLAGAPWCWKCGLQDRIAISTAEAEIRSMHAAQKSIQQAIWIAKLFGELGYTENQMKYLPILIHEDNTAAIS